MKWYEPFLIFPAFLYRLATDFRNHLFDIGHKKSIEFELPIISIGNLTVGGTGKTPMTAYLIRLLSSGYHIGVISRGYGRHTRGFRMLDDSATATTVGDEPLELYRQLSQQARFAVGEERAIAIPFLLAEYDDINLILLDDAYQHRYVKADIQLLLTRFDRLFTHDRLLPLGRLRESPKGANRANAVIITKCPTTITREQKHQITEEIKRFTKPETPVFFAFERQSPLTHVFNHSQPESFSHLLLITAIASNQSLLSHLQSLTNAALTTLTYPDHYEYKSSDVEKIRQWCTMHPQGIVVSTEKDMVKLKPLLEKASLQELPIFSIGVEVQFENDHFEKFLNENLKSTVNLR
jgi:tetraacyldisaccharide 4'-kinase